MADEKNLAFHHTFLSEKRQPLDLPFLIRPIPTPAIPIDVRFFFSLIFFAYLQFFGVCGCPRADPNLGNKMASSTNDVNFL
jgi:hypothetical protein